METSIGKKGGAIPERNQKKYSLAMLQRGKAVQFEAKFAHQGRKVGRDG